jgi:YfiH family protein
LSETPRRPEMRRLPGISVPHALTLRRGGTSRHPHASLDLGLHVGDDPERVRENRRRVAAALGLDPDHLTFAEQVHGAAVAIVGAAERGRGARRHEDALPGVDALVTATPGVPLAVLAADCLLALLHDPRARVLGVAHAGWRGLAAGVLEASLEAMESLGARPGELRVGLAPGIGPCCFEVGPEVVAAIGPEHARRARGRETVDLHAAARARLVDRGVRPDRIGADAACTVCSPEDLFSHRGSGGGPTGRHALIAWLRDA